MTQAEKWLEAHAYCQKHPELPRILAQEAAKRAGVALRKAKPFKAATRLPRGSSAITLPKLKKELDRVFSIFIRKRDSTGDYGRCVTCGHFAPWRNMDCGHYVPRQDLATRWDPQNCHLQCKKCNGFRGGEPEKMAAYIDAVYDLGTADGLRSQGKTKFRPTRQWLEQQIDWYKVGIGED